MHNPDFAFPDRNLGSTSIRIKPVHLYWIGWLYIVIELIIRSITINTILQDILVGIMFLD